MDDLISRQAAIVNMARVIWGYPNEIYPQLNDYSMALELAKDGLMGIPSAQQWIPCSERLPEEYVCVLCYQPILYGSNIWIGHLNSDGNWVDSDGWEKLTNPVTAWMPLPKPYEEDANG